MSEPLLGHLDPAFLAIADEVQSLLRELFGTRNPLTLPLAATGSGGMQACFTNLLEPGDRVVIGVAGVFGERMCDVATRLGAHVTRVETAWATALSEDALIEAIARVRPRAVAMVHAETSTGVLQPIERTARAARESGALVILDCVTSLAGLPVALDAWGTDAAYSGTQKCLSAPPGLSPVSFSPRALEHIAARRTPVSSWYFDATLLAGYYGRERSYHHTAPISAIFGLRKTLQQVKEEGYEARFERHRRAAAYLISELEALGFTPLVKAEERLPMLTALRLPEHVLRAGEASVRRRLLNEHGIEVGGGLGKLAGSIWRVGLMGENARESCVDTLVSALRRALT